MNPDFPDLKFPINELVRCSIEEYHAAPGISSSGLCEILRSPAHYQENYILNKKPPSDAMRFGTLMHFALFEPELFRKHSVVQPKFDKRTTVGKTEHAKWARDLKPDSIIVTEKDRVMLIGMMASIQKNPKAMKIFNRGHKEYSFWWIEIDKLGNKILCKFRPDLITEVGEILDLKTAEDARPKAFKRSVKKYHYDLRAAWYLRGSKVLREILKLQYLGKLFMFLPVEKTPPYANKIYHAGQHMIEGGERKLQAALELYRTCSRTNVWPSYPDGIETLDYTEWDFRDIEEEYGEEDDAEEIEDATDLVL